MERDHLKKYANDSSSRLATNDDLNALTNIVIALAQSVTDYVYEMGEHDEDAYDSRGELFEEDVDYSAQGEDCHYIPLLEDEIANYYNPFPLQNQQDERVDQSIGQYFGNGSPNLNFFPRQDDEEQEESSLAQLMATMITIQTQMMAMQAQQEKDFQFLTSELQQVKAAMKMLETQLAQQASNSYVFEEPMIKERASNEVVEEDVQLEHVEEEVEEQETPYVSPSAYIPPMAFPHRQMKVHVEIIVGNKVIDICQLTFDEGEVLSDKQAKNSYIVGINLNEVMKKSFHEGPEILICNTRLKEGSDASLPGR